ncbi:head GIN domain-containing protein [Candidatus Bipolaricaulota bacterium]
MSVATKSSGSYVTEKRIVNGFSSIHLRGFGRVRLQQTGTESLEVRAPKRWMDRIETKVKNGALILGFKKRVFPFLLWPMRNPSDLEFLITAETIDELRISGAGSFETDELKARDLRIGVSGAGRISSRGVDARDVRVSISGSGKVSFDRLRADTIQINGSGVTKVALDDVAVETLATSLSGAGSVKAAGSARDVEIRISGSGSLSLEELEAAHCKVRISGSGKIKVHATDSLETSISGSGTVLYKGTPQLSGRTSGSGRVRRIDED